MRMAVREPQHRAPPSDRTDRSVPPLYFCLRTLSRRRTRSTSVPERRASFQSLCHCAVRLPESFRGGCSFGAGSGPVSPAAMRTLECYLLCIDARCVIDYDRFVIHYSSIFEEHINVKAPAKGHLCPRYGFETRVPHGNARRVAERRQGVGRVRAHGRRQNPSDDKLLGRREGHLAESGARGGDGRGKWVSRASIARLCTSTMTTPAWRTPATARQRIVVTRHHGVTASRSNA